MSSIRYAFLLALLLGAAFALAPPDVAAQAGATVRGTVTDSTTGQPIDGAQVYIPNTAFGTVTSASGEYVLRDVPPGAITLQVRRLGYSTAERSIQVEPGADILQDFALEQTAISMEEIVAVGYGTQERRSLTSSVASVNTQEVENVPIAGIDGALLGKAAGVQIIQNAGNPGNGITVRIRGSSSIEASNEPLWVVDGIPLLREDFSQLGLGGQDLSAITGLDPDDIESIQVLKDAAATSIYGSRGSNGVIQITTKRGRSGSSRVTISAYAGAQEPERLIDMMEADEYIEFFNESAENDGYGPNFFGELGVVDSVNTDWQEEVTRSAPVQDYELALSGGEGVLTYYLSGSYYDQQGIVIGSGYGRINGRTNLSFDASDRLSFDASVALVREEHDRVENDNTILGIITNAIANQPHIPVRREQNGAYSSPADGLEYPNPMALADLWDVNARTFRAFGSIESNWTISDDLRATGRVGFDVLDMRENEYNSPEVLGTFAASTGGIAKTGYHTGTRYVLNGFLNWDPTLGDVHELSLTGGGDVEWNEDELNFVRGEGLSNSYLTRVRNAANIVDGDATLSEHNLVSGFGRANYTYDGRYVLSASARVDGSSRFGENDKYGFFPAASAAWIASEEDFLADSEFLEELKFRASYGVTGNEAIGNYTWQGLYGSANYDGVAGLAPSNVANPDLKWETTREFDVGVDASFFGGRLGIVADYYYKKTDDLLLDRPISTTSGFSSVVANVGNIENRGIELALNTVNVQSDALGGLRWTSSLNVSHNKNKVLELFNDEPFTGGFGLNRVEEGEELGAFWALHFEGVDPETGNAIFEDFNGDGSITTDDYQIVGSPHPDFQGGFRNTLDVGNFDVTSFLQFSYGAEIFNGMREFSDSGGYFFDNHFEFVNDRWQEPGDITDVPRASYDGTSGGLEFSDRWVEDATYLRIQEVTIGYELPESLTSLTGMRNGRIYVSGHNLYTFQDYTGYAPDVNSFGSGSNVGLGYDFYAYPLPRTITAGFRAVF